MLNIAMKLVMSLGEGRIQLECLCGNQFTFAPKDRINTVDEHTAKCPKCGSKWDGSIDDISLSHSMAIKYYAFYVRFDNIELNKRLGLDKSADGVVRIGVGIGADISHFAVPAIARFCIKHEPQIMLVKQISKTEYDSAKDESIDQYRASMENISNTLLDILLKETEEK